MDAERSSRLLDGVTVVSLETAGVVPATTAMMADLGANVIKVEHPGRGDFIRTLAIPDASTGPGGQNAYFQFLNRGKRAITLDVAAPAGRQIMHRLLSQADVFASSLLPTSLERLAFDYASIGERYPSLVYVTFNGYGKVGNEQNAKSMGPAGFWSRAGFAMASGDQNTGPQLNRTGWDDNTAALALLAGTLGALFHRARTGKGQEVHTSLYQVGTWVMGWLVQAQLSGGSVLPKMPFRASPLRSFYQCRDGQWIFVQAPTDDHWRALCHALGATELVNDPRFATPLKRMNSGDVLASALQSYFSQKTSALWVSELRAAGVITDVAQTVEDVVTDETALENGFFPSLDGMDGVRVVATPLQLSVSPPRVGREAPDIGQHTEEVLLEIGLKWDEITKLRSDGVT